MFEKLGHGGPSVAPHVRAGQRAPRGAAGGRRHAIPPVRRLRLRRGQDFGGDVAAIAAKNGYDQLPGNRGRYDTLMIKTVLAICALGGVLLCQGGAPSAPKPSAQVKTGDQDPKTPKPTEGPATQDPTKKDAPKKDAPQKETPKNDAPKQEPKVERPAEDAPMPTGTDPADIAAMRSAEQMLQVEKRLQKEIKAGKITGLDKILPFDELTSWPYEDGLKGMPKRVKALSGKKVLMTGFMLPIDEVQNIKEFLLVESLWSCCYGQPPDIHGIVRVVMPEKKTTDYFFDPLKIIGTFKVESTVMDGYCVDIYQLHVESLEAIRFQ